MPLIATCLNTYNILLLPVVAKDDKERARANKVGSYISQCEIASVINMSNELL